MATQSSAKRARTESDEEGVFDVDSISIEKAKAMLEDNKAALEDQIEEHAAMGRTIEACRMLIHRLEQRIAAAEPVQPHDEPVVSEPPKEAAAPEEPTPPAVPVADNERAAIKASNV